MRICAVQGMIALVLCGVSLAHNGYSQLLEKEVTLSLNDVSFEDVLNKLSEITKIKFAYSLDQLAVRENISIKVDRRLLREVLDELLTPRDITYKVHNREFTISLKKQNSREDHKSSMTEKSDDSRFDVQFQEITGTVTDADQLPMAGVNIIVKGTMNGTTTDAEGRYSIMIEPNDVLLFSFIGYAMVEIAFNGQGKIDVVMKADATTLEEVTVNAGYWNVKERENTGNIGKVTADVIEKQPVTNPLGALQGRIPGVYINQTTGVPGGEFNIQIRGRNSLRSDGNQPLYVVDGVPFSTDKTFSPFLDVELGGHTSTVSQVSPLTSLNQADIESVEILKDAGATSIYGSRGANGVVLITTKKGKAGKTTFDVNVYSGIGKVSRMKSLSTQQYLALRREAFANDNLTPSANPADPGYAPDLTVWDTTRYTDWQKIFMGGSAQTTSVQSLISGGSDQTQFLFSLGYRKENSVYPGDLGFQKGSFHLTLNHHSSDKRFSFAINLTGAKDRNNQLGYGLVMDARSLPPNAPALLTEDGDLNWENSTWRNPLGQAQVDYVNHVVNFIGNTMIGYELVSGLQFRTSIGLNYLQSRERNKSPHIIYDPTWGYTSEHSRVSDAAGLNQSWIIEPQLNWERKLKKRRLTALVGGTLQQQQFERKADSYFNFPSNALLDNLGSAANITNYESVQSLYRYVAIFGRLNYNLDGKYVINLTGRRDGSSRFGPGRQFANFAALGAAWIFSNESFFRDNLLFLSFGKLRSSFGSTGSDNIGDYQYLDTYSTSTTPFGSTQYQGVTWIAPTKLFNPDYAWEVNRKFEIGFELGFLKDRVSLAMSYFNNRSSSQLVNYTLPLTTGFSGILANLPATVSNTGIEVELTATNLQAGTFQWTTSFNVTFPRNKLIEFPDLESSTYANVYVVGEPLFVEKVFEWTGVNGETGLYTFTDVNGDGIISNPEDKTKVVFKGQDFFGGLNNTVTWRGWSMDIFFQFVRQRGSKPSRTGRIAPGLPANMPAVMLEKRIWRQPGDVAEIQRPSTEVGSVAGNDAWQARANYLLSDGGIGDASFIRLKNVALSYELPKNWTKHIKCRFYFHGQNLLTITDYEGDDPENQYYSTLGPLQMYTLGVQLAI